MSKSTKLAILILVIIGIISFFLTNLNAQDSIPSESTWKINSISLSTGETTLSSGLCFSVAMSKKDLKLMADYNTILGELILFYSPTNYFSIGPSGGIFKNVLWAGPIGSFSFFKGHITTLNWIGWALGDPEEESTSRDFLFCFSYQQISLNWKNISGYYVLQHYIRCVPESIFGLKCSFNISKSISAFGDAAYMLHNDRIILSTGIKYEFNSGVNY